MTYSMDAAARARLESYFDLIGDALGTASRRESFAIYATGLLGDADRKSVEPIAARACPDPVRLDAFHQRLLHFVTDGTWSDADVRAAAARYAIGEMTSTEPIDAWVVDDTGFLKQGKHSVGVQRQYTGSAGKIANCQIGVSLVVSTATAHLPIDFELYLPRSWTDDETRRKEARIPADTPFMTKHELAVTMLRRAVAADVPRGVVLADAAYGNSSEFRNTLEELGLDYIVGIDGTTGLYCDDAPGQEPTEPLSARDLALRLCYVPKQFQRVVWREGTGGRLTARFAFRRVAVAHGRGDPAKRRRVWFIAEWRDGEVQPTKFYLARLPHGISKKRMVRVAKERYRTERVYEELKGELGLDHFEGRRFRGWHHHVSVALCCYAFVVAERVRRFPPCGAIGTTHDQVSLAA